MISNFHQSSGPHETAASSYYTFDEPKGTPKNNNNNKKTKKKGRIFGLGKSKQNKNKKTTELGDSWRPYDDNSTLTGQSLTYSTSAASYQTTGESTDSSGGAFGEILKMLDEEEQREMMEKRKQQPKSDRSMYSTTSSLAYSEGGTTLNYSEDGDQSYLEGTKLLGMLSDSSLQPLEPSPPPATRTTTTGAIQQQQQQQQQERYVMSPNKTPVVDNKSRSNRPTRDHSLRRERTSTEMVQDEDPVSSSSSSSSPWLCGIDLGDAGAALRPFLCF